MSGRIVSWKPSTGRGQISANGEFYPFDAKNSPGLAESLSDTIIPPDDPVAVTFALASGEAINIVKAPGIDIAASGT